MLVAHTPEQAVRQHLEKIQHTIANQLCIGALFPERRQDCAQQVADLKQEAQRIAQQPERFQAQEPWQIQDADGRANQIELTVNSAFHMAPEGHLLTDCLIDYWKDTLRQVAEQADPKLWERFGSLMRRDAEAARRSKPTIAQDVTTPLRQEPDQLVLGLQKRLAKIAETKAGQTNADHQNNPWEKAYTQALRLINQRAVWLLYESENGTRWTVDEPTDSMALKAIKHSLREEFRLMQAQTLQLEQTLDAG